MAHKPGIPHILTEADITTLKIAGTAITATAAEINTVADGITATAAEVNRVSDLSLRVVDLTAATLAVTLADHGDRTITVNKADGTTITLPAATGTGMRLRIFVGTTITSNALVVEVADDSDIMSGVAFIANDSDASVSGFETAADSDTITMNGTTTGGIKGDLIELEDVAANLWSVQVRGSATGSEATPFSAAV